MKKYKGLSRIFLLSYLVWAFGGLLCSMLLIKQGGFLPIFSFVITGIDLAIIIAARCLFKSNYRLYFILSIAGFAILNILCIGSFIIELVYTLQGIPAIYAWFISIISIVLCAVIDYFYITSTLKIHHKRLVEEGIIQEKEEEI